MSEHPIPAGSGVVVMTGATSGIGAAAIGEIARQPDIVAIVGARRSGRAVPAGVETLLLDLASLDSVRQFAAAVVQRLDGVPFDARWSSTQGPNPAPPWSASPAKTTERP